ncbi:Gfo/Idh/MocA family protein [Conyzicola sp.]|uniref:Gfo/Idh/MocA family protein n=1 Tax=Conyzicola sp. TaxID=1969404 RepID=UPI003989F930
MPQPTAQPTAQPATAQPAAAQPGTAQPAVIGLIGAGWRAEYFLRIARDLPERFVVARVLVRTEASATSVGQKWGVPTGTSLADFVKNDFDYVVVSAPWDAVPELIEALVAAGIPVLSETPPAPDVAALRSLWGSVGGAGVQVAEQYHLQPHHAARLAVVRSGLIGEVSSARVSVAHGYHGVSLARLYLDVGFEPVTVRADGLTDPLLSSNGRVGWKETLEPVPGRRTVALLRFGAKSAVFDFTDEQYFSPVRSRHLSVRGDRGEIWDNTVSHLAGPGDPVTGELQRDVTGVESELSGNYLRRVTLHTEVYFENRFAPARLNDDEIAVAESMHRMSVFVATGEPFYPLAEASHDHYLGLLIDEAAVTGETVRSEAMPWQA